MANATAERIIEQNAFPLRIMVDNSKRYLACPYELTLDNFEARFLDSNPKIVHF
jgi:hypothetical protein